MEVRIYDGQTDNEVGRLYLSQSDGKPSKKEIINNIKENYNIDTVYWSVMQYKLNTTYIR